MLTKKNRYKKRYFWLRSTLKIAAPSLKKKKNIFPSFIWGPKPLKLLAVQHATAVPGEVLCDLQIIGPFFVNGG